MTKTVYNVDQLPSTQDNEKVQWSADDYNIWIDKTENNKLKLSGESLEWNEEEDEWKGCPLSKNECIEIAEEYKLVLPMNGGMKQLSDIFKRE